MASAFPSVVETDDKVFVWIGTFSRLELMTDLEIAKQTAKQEAEQNTQYRYVLPFKGGYLVLSYAELVGCFFDLKDDYVFKVEPHQGRRGDVTPVKAH